MDENMDMESIPGDVASTEEAIDIVEVTLDKFLDTARVEAVYGQPIQHGENLIVPCAEVLAGMGFGVGYGSGPANVKKENGDEEQAGQASGGGGGGGGRTFSRPVAVIVASPDGVRVEPVVDVTKLGLAAFTAGGFMLGMIMRMLRGRVSED